MINTYITTLPGLPNVNLPLPPSTLISDVIDDVFARLKFSAATSKHISLSTTSGRLLPPSKHASLRLSDLCLNDNLLTLRLTGLLCGGKGGFGSQLRAAGGRMSSRKKSQENSDSCRNLDGRRMRTVKEAKALAAWLEVKPEMEKTEKEKRMKRWKDIVESAERKESEGEKKRFDDSEWLEGLEEGREKTREAVLESLRRALEPGSSGESSGDEEVDGKMTVAVVHDAASSSVAEKKFVGWDDEDEEFMSSDDEMEDIQEDEGDEVGQKGKGKA